MLKQKFKTVPNHMAFIIDGNGRWATKRGLTRSLGHRAGINTLKSILQKTFDAGVNVVSVFAFSTENWNRPEVEVEFLMDLFREFLSDDFIKELNNSVKLSIMGDYTKFPQDLVNQIEKLLEYSKQVKTNKTLNIGLNYGSRDEIIMAVNNIIKDKLTSVNKQVFSNYLYTADLPPLDFVVRTSGEQRLSNFMLWQSAYSELYFPKVFWPDFTKRHLIKSLKEYEKRSRRFGAIKENK